MDYQFKAGSVSSCGVNDYRKKKDSNLTLTIMPVEIIELLGVIIYFNVIVIISSFDRL